MESSSPKQKKPLKPKSKFANADEFLDAVTPTLIDNLDREERSKVSEEKKPGAVERSDSNNPSR
jgi:hypothetical protein